MARETAVVEAARQDIGTFAAYVFGLKRLPFHEFMHSLIARHPRITIDAPFEHAKTTQCSIILPLFALGRNRNHLIANVSSTSELPRRSLGVIRRHLEENDRLKRVFPGMKMVEDTNFSITLDRPRGMSKDPSFAAMGIEGALLGRRWTMLISDDILRFNTVWTEHEREKIWKRLTAECLSRLTLGAPHYDVGTPWVQNDARHRLRKLPSYVFFRFDGWTGDVYDAGGKLIHQFPGGLWPEVCTDPMTGIQYGWPRWRLEEARANMEFYEFDRMIRCVAMSDATESFGSHLDACLELGRGIKLQEETTGKVDIAWRHPEPSWKYAFSGVDLAIDKRESAADTCFYTGAIDGRSRHLLEIRRGKMNAPEILRSMIEIVRRYPSIHRIFRVESNAAQQYLLQMVQEPGIMETLGATREEAARIEVTPHATTANKNMQGIGIKSMSLEFSQRRWPIPCDENRIPAKLVQKWIDGLRGYDPISHADDSVVASWLFSEQCRLLGVGGTQWDRFGISAPR